MLAPDATKTSFPSGKVVEAVLDFGRFEVRASRAPTYKIYWAHHFIWELEINWPVLNRSIRPKSSESQGHSHVANKEHCSKFGSPGLFSKSSTGKQYFLTGRGRGPASLTSHEVSQANWLGPWYCLPPFSVCFYLVSLRFQAVIQVCVPDNVHFCHVCYCFIKCGRKTLLE